jgi:hypothetical protein
VSGVVLRCPNCGTTQAGRGECDACHEAQVRPYCTNHTPGRWLDALTCPQCGAQFGEETRRPTEAPPPRQPSPGSSGRTEPPTRQASRPSPVPRRSPWSGGRQPTPTVGSEGDAIAEPEAAVRRWPKLRRPSPRMRRAPEVRVDELSGMPIEVALGGCRRAVFLGLFLIAFLVKALLQKSVSSFNIARASLSRARSFMLLRLT